MFKSYLLPTFLCLLGAAHAQHQVSGYVYSQENNIQSPLVSASVYWENSTSGTVSNDDGYFTLVHNPLQNHLYKTPSILFFIPVYRPIYIKWIQKM